MAMREFKKVQLQKKRYLKLISVNRAGHVKWYIKISSPSSWYGVLMLLQIASVMKDEQGRPFIVVREYVQVNVLRSKNGGRSGLMAS